MKAFTIAIILSLASFVLAVPIRNKVGDVILISVEINSGKNSVYQNVDYIGTFNSLPTVRNKCGYILSYSFTKK